MYEKVRWDVGWGCRGGREGKDMGDAKSMLFGGACSICSLVQGHSPEGTTV